MLIFATVQKLDGDEGGYGNDSEGGWAVSKIKWVVSLVGIDRDYRPFERIFEVDSESDANEKAIMEKREYLRIFPGHAIMGYPIVEVQAL